MQRMESNTAAIWVKNGLGQQVVYVDDHTQQKYAQNLPLLVLEDQKCYQEWDNEVNPVVYDKPQHSKNDKGMDLR